MPALPRSGWEKWALAHACDEFLEIVVSLANSIVRLKYFPPALKEAYITPLHKRGVVVDPKNYRGICLSNVLYQAISSWFGSSLQSHIHEKGLLSPTQAACQAGVQTGDLIQLLLAMDLLCDRPDAVRAETGPRPRIRPTGPIRF